MSFRCDRCDRTDQQMTQKPLGGRLGDEILNAVCQPCWDEWNEMQLKIINEYRLNLAVPQHFDMLVDEMKNFLKLTRDASGNASISVDDQSDKTY